MFTSCVPIHPSSYRHVLYNSYGEVRNHVVACMKHEVDGETFNFVVLNAGLNYYKLFHVETRFVVSVSLDVPSLMNEFELSNYSLGYIRERMEENRLHHHVQINGPFGRTIVDWKYREAQRLETGEYLPLPGIGIDFNPDHFIHRSIEKDQDDYVAYTLSDSHGLQNRQTCIRLGRYLKKYFPSMSDAEVVAVVDRFKAALAREAAPFELKFATDRETINTIFETEMYANGSSCKSCMYGKFEHWVDRPYHVYADSPDVAVAYLDRLGEIVARSVVSTKDNMWVRLYSVDQGESTLCKVLREKLEDAGYENGDLDGSRLTRLPDRQGRVVLPYIDGYHGVKSCRGGYWMVVDSGHDYCGDRTDGYGEEEEEHRCFTCENLEDECSCIYCECCGASVPDGCDECSMCPECDRCISHDRCQCDRCSDCNEIIFPSLLRTDRCRCDRCDDCTALEVECDCPRCDECEMLATQCECEQESETNESNYVTSDAEVSTPCMV